MDVAGLHPDTTIRQVRLVPVGGGGPVPDHPVDLTLSRGVVTAVGTRLPRLGEEYDAAGRWAVPGLWDHHVHLAQWGLTMRRLDLSGAAAAEEATDRVARHVATLGAEDDSVVVGFGHRIASWPRPPTVAELDAVGGTHPVVLVSGDGHHGWLSSKALDLFGLPRRDTVLAENDWFGVFGRLDELPGAAAAQEEGLAAAVSAAARRGIVGIGDMELAAGYLDWPERFAAGVDALRVRVATYPDRLEEVIAAGLRSGSELGGSAGLLRMGPLKIISDGSLNTATAWCHQPYAGSGVPAYGAPNYSPAQLVELVDRAARHGLRVAVHAIGDAAVSSAVDAFTATGAAGSIEHAQLVATTDLPRMAALGVVASVQPAHLLDDRDVTQRCWPDRADRCFPLRSMLAAGVRLAFGSDAPVAPLDPWLAMAAAVHRSGDDRPPWHPEQSVTAAEALAASTDGQPTLAVGGRADVVLLDDDPLTGAATGADATEHPDADPEADSGAAASVLRRMTVAATFVAGRPTYLAL